MTIFRRVPLLLAATFAVLLTAAQAWAGQAPPQDLMAAVKAGDVGGVQALLAKGADVNAADADGMTPLIVAAFRGDRATAEVLLSAGAMLDAKDSAGITALHAGAFKGSAELVQILLARGASVNARDGAGMTPLHYAASSGSEEAAKALLASGADATVVSAGGLKPAEEARKNGHAALADSLQERASAQLAAAPQAPAKAPRLITNADVEKAAAAAPASHGSQAPPPAQGHPAQGTGAACPSKGSGQAADLSALYSELDKLAREKRDLEAEIPKLQSDCSRMRDSHKQGESNIQAGPGIVAGPYTVESSRRAYVEELVACRPLQQAQWRLQAIEQRREQVQRQIDGGGASGGAQGGAQKQNRPNKPQGDKRKAPPAG